MKVIGMMTGEGYAIVPVGGTHTQNEGKASYQWRRDQRVNQVVTVESFTGSHPEVS